MKSGLSSCGPGVKGCLFWESSIFNLLNAFVLFLRTRSCLSFCSFLFPVKTICLFSYVYGTFLEPPNNYENDKILVVDVKISPPPIQKKKKKGIHQ